jgi:hypothetical protein
VRALRRRLVGLMVVGTVLLAACERGESAPAGSARPSLPGSTASGTSAATPTTGAAEQAAVERAYREFWRLQAVFDSRYPESQWRQVLGRVAVDPELTRSVSGARLQHRQGIRVYGQVYPRPTVLPVNGRALATVRDCADASHAGQAEASTGRPRSVGIARMPLLATLVRGGDGRWRVSDLRFPGGAC